MVNPLKELDKTLGILSDVETLQKEPWNYEHKNEKVVSVDKGQDIESDYEYQRQNFYNLVEKGTTAIDGILLLAKESEHPRTYEVAGNLIKQVSEVAEKLGDLQEKMKKLSEVPDNAPKNVTNALFVGSTAELQKMIKGND
mgnify:CR=1 FL=1|tara:strand:+ start:6482 stop:6904 length:423 start_codon:yes stop_codon:yes gene_type:complete